MLFKFDRGEFRTVLAECCTNIFSDNAMREMFFSRICNGLDNFLSDNIYSCEECKYKYAIIYLLNSLEEEHLGSYNMYKEDIKDKFGVEV